MSDEATLQVSLNLSKDSPAVIQYRSYPTNFSKDVTGAKGPTPGAITVQVAGTNVDLDELTTPGLCRIYNLDPTNFVTVGIWDPESTKFYPLMEVGPAEFYVFTLSRYLGSEYGAGTGTSGPLTNRLQIRADTAACVVLVEAFEA